MHGVRRQAAILIGVVCLLGSLSPLALTQSAPVSISEAVSALRAGKTEDALRICDELLRAAPQSYKVWTVRAVALEQARQPKEALKSYEQALNVAPDYLPALEGAAQLHYKAQSAQAVPLLRKIIAIQPADPTAHAILGVLEYRQADYGPAAQDFDAAEQVLSSQPAALMDYAICLVRLNRASEAVARFKQLLTLQPSNVPARYNLALMQWRSGAGADALTTLQPMLDAGTTDSRVLRLAAAIHEANNETPQAVELLRTAIMDNPNELANYVDFATLSFLHGSYSVGIDIVNLGLNKLPNSAELYMTRGVLYGQNGDFEKAMSDFEHANKLDPAYSMAATAEGIAQSQRHNHEEALRDFRRQVREHPKDAFGYYLLAEALSWSPPNAKPEDNQKSVSEAISSARKATELDSKLVQAYDLLASLYLQTNQPVLAVKECRAALKINPKDQQAVYTLILSLRKTGEKQELNNLVKRLTDLRKAEGDENSRKFRYGQLVEGP